MYVCVRVCPLMRMIPLRGRPTFENASKSLMPGCLWSKPLTHEDIQDELRMSRMQCLVVQKCRNVPPTGPVKLNMNLAPLPQHSRLVAKKQGCISAVHDWHVDRKRHPRPWTSGGVPKFKLQSSAGCQCNKMVNGHSLDIYVYIYIYIYT